VTRQQGTEEPTGQDTHALPKASALKDLKHMAPSDTTTCICGLWAESLRPLQTVTLSMSFYSDDS
jgi:hypothetical protein